MKQKMVCYLLMAALAFSLLMGCSNSSDSASVGIDNTDYSFADKTVGVCIYQMSDNFMNLFSKELVKYLTEQGFSEDNLLVYNSSNSEAKQLTQVEELLDKKVDVLIVNPVNANIASSITDMAVANSTPLVYINREPGADEESRWEDYNLNVTYVGCDARQSGIYQGELILALGITKLDKNTDGKLQYYMLEGAPENTDAAYRTKYSVSTLENAGIELDCLLNEVGNWDRNTAKSLTLEGLKNGLTPEVIICNNDAMALGAIDALTEYHIVPGQDIYIVGVDALPEALDKITDGQLLGSVFNDYVKQSHSAADAAINYIKGQPNEHYIGCDYVKVSSYNVAFIKNRQK